jgi:hypothetical protein
MTTKVEYQRAVDDLTPLDIDQELDIIKSYVAYLEQSLESLEKELDYLEQGVYNGNMKRKKQSWDDER